MQQIWDIDLAYILRLSLNALLVSSAIFVSIDKRQLTQVNARADATRFREPLSLELADFLRFLQHDNCLVIDTRRPDHFAADHIGNAIHLPASKTKRAPLNQLAISYKSSFIMIYHYGTPDADSWDLAESLIEAGASNVGLYIGGWNEWVSCKLPTVTSELGQTPNPAISGGLLK